MDGNIRSACPSYKNSVSKLLRTRYGKQCFFLLLRLRGKKRDGGAKKRGWR